MVEKLSGGQRQRVWVAMLLAQHAPLMLLDVPTTFHDLAQAARYADHLVVMHAGRVHSIGPPSEVITSELVQEVFGLRTLVVPDPVTGTPWVVPLDPRRPA